MNTRAIVILLVILLLFGGGGYGYHAGLGIGVLGGSLGGFLTLLIILMLFGVF